MQDPERFYQNYKQLVDDPETLDRKTLLLTCIYKFARHEWAGISAAWDVVRSMAKARNLKDRISRIHLAEEFCHTRLFNEMLRTFQPRYVPLDPVQVKRAKHLVEETGVAKLLGQVDTADAVF